MYTRLEHIYNDSLAAKDNYLIRAGKAIVAYALI